MHIRDFVFSFKGKLTLLVVAAILLPLLVVAMIARQVLQERIHHSFSNELNAGLESIALILGWLEQDLVMEVTRIASDDGIEDQLYAGTVPELKRMLTSQRKVVDLALLATFNLDHELLASSKFKSKNLVIDFNKLEQLQVAYSEDEYYLIYTLPITKKKRTVGYVAGGILLSDENLLSYLQSKHISNTAFWLDSKLLLTDLKTQTEPARPRVLFGEMFDAHFSDKNYKGILRAQQLGAHRLEYALFIPTIRLEEAELELTIALAVVVVVLFVLCLSFLASILDRMIKPLQHLTAYARQLSTNHFSPRVDSALTKLAGSSHDEVGKLADAFVQMERQLRAYLDELTETTRTNERMQSELRIARDIQMSMLPQAAPELQRERTYQIAAALEPAREVGGDFYDFFMVDDKHLCFVIGDVSGKGIPASLFMAVSRALVRAVTNMTRTYANNGRLPEEVLTRVNQELCRENDVLMFVTLFYGILDTQTGEIVYSTAGHNPPFVLSPLRGVLPLQHLHASPLGVKSATQYRSHTITLRAYETLFLYTDGITEALDTEGQLFSEPRLQLFLQNCLHGTAEVLARDTLSEVKKFSGGAPASDDMTVLALKYLPQKNLAARIHNRLDDLQRLMAMLEEFGAMHAIAREDVLHVRLAVEEIITNTLKYGYRDEAEHDIAVEFRLHENVLTSRIEDDAEDFNPLEAHAPSRNGKAAGGYGLKLLRELMDEYHYLRQEGKNILTIKKCCRLVEKNSTAPMQVDTEQSNRIWK